MHAVCVPAVKQCLYLNKVIGLQRCVMCVMSIFHFSPMQIGLLSSEGLQDEVSHSVIYCKTFAM